LRGGSRARAPVRPHGVLHDTSVPQPAGSLKRGVSRHSSPKSEPNESAAPAAWRHDLLALVLSGALVLVILFTAGVSPGYSAESVRRASVARDLVAGLSRGRQGLVGSLVLAPVPTAAVALLSAVPRVGAQAISGCILAGFSAVFLCMYVNRLWAREGISAWLRYPALASLLALPPVAMSIESGQSTMLFVALVVCGWGFLSRWLHTLQLRDVAYAGLLLAISVGVRFQALFLVALGLLFALAAMVVERRSFALLEATAIIFLTPTLYVVTLWIGGNWLILGDPFFFARGLVRSLHAGAEALRPLLAAGCEWPVAGAVGLLVLMVPMAGLLSRRTEGGLLRHAAALTGVLAAALCALAAGPSIEATRADPRIPAVIATLEQRHNNGSFIVTGYEGYEFVQAAGDDPEHSWIHLMHLEPSVLGRILREFEGREIYVLVDTEATLEQWEDVGLRWQEPGTCVPEGFLYAETVGPWVVFECIRRHEALVVEGRTD